MKLPTSSGRLKRPKTLIVRRVKGDSMLPSLRPEQIVIASGLIKLRPSSVVIVRRGKLEIVKRLSKISKNKVFIMGDHSARSTDSREFGWISRDDVLATVIWPKNS